MSTVAYQFPKDTFASIYTAGLLGEQYVGLDVGGDEKMLKAGDTIAKTQSAVVLEKMISQFLFSKAADGQDKRNDVEARGLGDAWHAANGWLELSGVLHLACAGRVLAEGNPRDPYEGFNRAMFAVNEWWIRYAAKPVAQVYDHVAPLAGKGRCRQFLRQCRRSVDRCQQRTAG